MERVSTANSYSVVLAGITRAQQAQDEANAQLSSGKKATDLRGYASDAQALVAARSVRVQSETYVKMNEDLNRRISSQDLYLNSTADAADSARQAISSAVASGKGTALMQSLQIQFSAAIDSLNGQHEGQYLFAGSLTSTKPVNIAKMSDLGTTTVAAIFQNDSLAQTNRLNDTSTVTTGFTASAVGTPLLNVFKAIQDYVVANGPFSDDLTEAQSSFLTTQMQALSTAHDGLIDNAGLNGSISKSVDSAIANHQSRIDAVDNVTSDLSSINEAETVSRLKLAQQAVQASAQVFLTLKSSSLLNFLN